MLFHRCHKSVTDKFAFVVAGGCASEVRKRKGGNGAEWVPGVMFSELSEPSLLSGRRSKTDSKCDDVFFK